MRLHRALQPSTIAAARGNVEQATYRPKYGNVPGTLHLAYHLYPTRTYATMYNVARVNQSIHKFARARISIATDDGSHSFEEARSWFPDRCEFLHVPNSQLRDAAALRWLLEGYETRDPDHAVLFSHGKSVTRANNPASWTWAEVMYRRLWDDPAAVILLRDHACVGTVMWDRPVRFQDKSSTPWHYAGSFYWMRADELYARDWQRKPAGGWHAEAFPAFVFQRSEAGFLGPSYTVRPSHAGSHFPLPDPCGRIIDIGGGSKPYPGAVNVDRCETADVRMDLETDPLPFPDDSVDAIHTSHCLEHITNLRHLLREMVRVVRPGGTIDIRVPHFLSAMAMCHDHKQVIPIEQIRHWCETAVEYWLDTRKRLFLIGHRDMPRDLSLARKAYPSLTDEERMQLVPDAAHETHFQLLVWAQ